MFFLEFDMYNVYVLYSPISKSLDFLDLVELIHDRFRQVIVFFLDLYYSLNMFFMLFILQQDLSISVTQFAGDNLPLLPPKDLKKGN